MSINFSILIYCKYICIFNDKNDDLYNKIMDPCLKWSKFFYDLKSKSSQSDPSCAARVLITNLS